MLLLRSMRLSATNPTFRGPRSSLPAGGRQGAAIRQNAYRTTLLAIGWP